MVDQYLRETESLAEVREATAGVMAEEKRCKKPSDENRGGKQRSTMELSARRLPPATRLTPACSSRRSRELGGALALRWPTRVRRPTPTRCAKMHDKLVADIEELNARKATIKAKGRRGENAVQGERDDFGRRSCRGCRSAFDRMEAKPTRCSTAPTPWLELSEKPADFTEELAKKYAPPALKPPSTTTLAPPEEGDGSGVGLAFAPQSVSSKQTYLSHRLRGDSGRLYILHSKRRLRKRVSSGVSWGGRNAAASLYSRRRPP